jgi:MYXO-CTERM domain-containing protein
MSARLITCVASLVIAAGFGQPALGQFLIDVSCDGTVCGGGGGGGRYQYTLMNTSGATLTLTDFCPGTDDLNIGNYTSWYAPPGFIPTATVAPWSVLSPPMSVMYTSGVQTPHGAIPPPGGPATAGGIAWTGSVTLLPNATATFGFDNPNTYEDVEWQAYTSAGYSVAWSDLPVAGPAGTFTHGYVHAPVPEPTMLTLLTLGGLALLRRRG